MQGYGLVMSTRYSGGGESGSLPTQAVLAVSFGGRGYCRRRVYGNQDEYRMDLTRAGFSIDLFNTAAVITR